MAREVRLVALGIGRAGDEALRWPVEDVRRLLRPSPPQVPADRRLTVGDYWADCTGGAVDLSGSQALGWFELDDALADDVWRLFTPEHLRWADDGWLVQAVQLLLDGCLTGPLAGPDAAATVGTLRSADGLVLLTTAESTVHWTQPVDLGGGHRGSAAYLSTRATHTSICHEVGHLLGYGHSFGLPSPDLGREYGDPYCIMSARRFGGRADQVTTAVADPPLLPGARLWQQVGPRPAQSLLWAAGPEPAEGIRVDGVRVLAPSLDGGPQPVRLAHVGRPGPEPHLLVLPLAAGGGEHWLTAEVRGPLPAPGTGVDWDGALALDRLATATRAADHDTSDAAGVVLHEVVGGQVVYRETVALPPGADTDAVLLVDGHQVTLRLTGWSDGVATLLVGAAPAVPMVWGRVEHAELPDGTLRFTVQLLSTGYHRPVFSWEVAGVTLLERSGLGSAPRSRMLEVPSAAGQLHVVVAEACWDRMTVDVPTWRGPGGRINVRVAVHEGAEDDAHPGPPPSTLEPRVSSTLGPGRTLADPVLDLTCTT